MGYGIMPYRVSLERLRSRLGTQDEARRQRLKGVCLKKAQDMDRLGSNSAPKFMEIVEELLNGQVKHEQYGYLYWYAIKCFISDLGVMLDNGKWYPASADMFWEMGAFALYDIGTSIKIPASDDFPVVFVLSQEKMTQDFIQTLSEKVKEQGQLSQLTAWVKEAKLYQQDLVLFYH
jgi:hypothetical protein